MHHILDRIAEAGPHADVPSTRFAGTYVSTRVPFRFEARRAIFGETSITQTSHSPMMIEPAERGPHLDYQLGFLLSGGLTVAARFGETVQLSPGNAFLSTSRNSLAGQNDADVSTLVIGIPPSVIRNRGIRVADGPLIAPSATGLDSAVLAFAATIIRASNPTSGNSATIIERTLNELVTGLLLETFGFELEPTEASAGLRARAMDLIIRRADDPLLSPTRMAQELHCSLRSLQRSFSDADTSVAKEIANARIVEATRLIETPPMKRLTLPLIAARTGFASTAALRARFLTVHGQTVSEYRDNLRALNAGSERLLG
ncbi:AraC family transcriptional regulator [Subtercola endophyticus]|nr:AraC family transcriptional regulator [Subtercola endophyticus]